MSSSAAREGGGSFLHLLSPKIRSNFTPGRAGQGRRGRALLAAGTAVVVLPLLHLGLARLLASLRETPEIGPLLASRLLGFGLLLMLGILLISSVIGALSSFFLSRDLHMVRVAPVDWLHLYGARLTETVVSASWMVVLLLIPVVTAYGTVYGGGPVYYGAAVLGLVPLTIIAGALGAAVTLLLVRAFPARRTRDLLGLVAVGAVALLVAGLRVLRPERLVNPEEFRNLVDFLDLLRAPTLAWFPSEWAAETLLGPLRGGIDPMFPILLWTTAGAAFVMGAVLHRRMFDTCFTRAQEGADRRVRNQGVWSWLERALSPLGLLRRELVLKDTRTFFRDATQWSQLIVLGVLVIVYVYNVHVLPVRANPAIGPFLVGAVALLNVALTGFVLAAVSARFVFPAPSLEGRTLWLLQSSPLPPETFVWSKFWSGAVPLLVLGTGLSLLTSLALGAGRALTGLAVATVAGLTFAFTAQALAWGVTFPKFDSENPAQIPTSSGGLLFMMGALVCLVVVVGGEAWLLRDHFLGQLPWRSSSPLAGGELWAALGYMGVTCLAGTVLPYRYARRRIERLEV